MTALTRGVEHIGVSVSMGIACICSNMLIPHLTSFVTSQSLHADDSTRQSTVQGILNQNLT